MMEAEVPKRSKRPRPSCKAKAVDFLARSDQSIQRLTEKLQRKEYSQEEIQETIAWLQEKHFLREEDGCQRRFENMYKNTVYSLRQIVAKLRQQGYDKDLVQSFVPDDAAEREYQAAYKVLSRKFKPGTEKQKMYQHLCMKGFGYDVARNAVDDLIYHWDEEDEGC